MDAAAALLGRMAGRVHNLEVSCGHSIQQSALAFLPHEGEVDVFTPSACGGEHIDIIQCWHAAGDARRAGGACGSR